MQDNRRLEESRAMIRENLFGGDGAVRVWNCLSSPRTAPFTAVLWCALDAGGSVGRHLQTEYPEVILCLSSTGHAFVNETRHPLGKGALVYLPLGATLSLPNESDAAPLEYVIIKAEAGEKSVPNRP